MRLPYGKFDDRVLAVAASLGFTVTAWNIDTNDYQSGLSAGEIAAAFSTPMSLIAPGTGRYIAVLHDVSPVYYDGAILQPTFNEIKNRQYKAVTLNTCLEENEAYRTTNDAAAMKGASWIAAPLAMVAALLM